MLLPRLRLPRARWRRIPRAPHMLCEASLLRQHVASNRLLRGAPQTVSTTVDANRCDRVSLHWSSLLPRRQLSQADQAYPSALLRVACSRRCVLARCPDVSGHPSTCPALC